MKFDTTDFNCVKIFPRNAFIVFLTSLTNLELIFYSENGLEIFIFILKHIQDVRARGIKK